jgi:chemotaxis protein CheD
MNAAAPPERLEVAMGELKIGDGNVQLHAILGSCVGIGFIWKRRGRCGLAHCLLPEAPAGLNTLGARYVSQAVPSLLTLMGAREADYRDIEVVLAGGASMFKAESQFFKVGQRNAEAALKYMAQRGLRMACTDLGGNSGRQMFIDSGQRGYVITGFAGQHKEDIYGGY